MLSSIFAFVAFLDTKNLAGMIEKPFLNIKNRYITH